MNRATPLVLGLTCLTLVACSSTQTAKQEEPVKSVETQPVTSAPLGPTAPAPTAAPSNDSYTVVRGDHLWGISSKPGIYGDAYKWPLIYKANRDKINDADLIEPGQVLTINRGASSAEVDAAVRHARTRGAWSLGVVEESDRAFLGGKSYAAR